MSNQKNNNKGIWKLNFGLVPQIMAYIIMLALLICTGVIWFLGFPVWTKVFVTLGTIVAAIIFTFRKSISKTRFIGLLSALLILVALLLCFFDQSNKIDNLTKNVPQTTVSTDTVSKSDYSKLQAEKDKLQADYDKLQADYSKLQEDYDKLQTENKELEKGYVAEDVRCPICGGDTTKAGCTHNQNVKTTTVPTPVAAPTPIATKDPVVTKAPVPTVKPTEVPTATPTPKPKDTEIPTGKLSVNKTHISVGETVQFKYVGKDNIGLVDPVKADSQEKQLQDKLEGLNVKKISISSIGFDDVKWKKYSTNFSYKFTKAGTYKVYIEKALLKDRAGNISKKSNVITIIVSEADKKAPTVTLKSDKTVINVGEKVSFTVNMEDDMDLNEIQSIETSVKGLKDISNNGSIIKSERNSKTYSAELSYKFNEAGVYEVYLPAGVAKDKSGNQSLESNKITINVNQATIPNPTTTPSYPSNPTPTPTPTVPAQTETSIPVVTLSVSGTDHKIGTTAPIEITAWDRNEIKSFVLSAANFSGLNGGITITDLQVKSTTKNTIIYQGIAHFTAIGSYGLSVDKGVAINVDGKTSAASNPLTINVFTDQAASGDVVLNPIANDVTRPVVTLSGATKVNGDTFTLNVNASDNSGKCVLQSANVVIENLPSGLSLVGMSVISDTTAQITLKATEVGSYSLTIAAGAAKDSAGNTSIQSAEALVFITPATVVTAQTSTAETTATVPASTDNSSIATLSTTTNDTTTSTTTVTNTSTATTATVDTVSTSTSTTTTTTPQVEVPTTVSPDDIVWE